LKGNDKALVRVAKDNDGNDVYNFDEPHYDLKTNFITAIEAYARMLSYPQVMMSHGVHALAINDPDNLHVVFREGDEGDLLETVDRHGVDALRKRTKFEAYMHLCATNQYHGKFEDVNYFFSWKPERHSWEPRVGGEDETRLSRIYTFPPSNPRMYAIRLIVTHRGNITDWEDLRTYKGHLYNTYQEVSYNKYELHTFKILVCPSNGTVGERRALG
jgi:hypothetical protein